MAANHTAVILFTATTVIPAFAGIQKDCKMKLPCVYILSNQRNGTLYIAVTPNLIQRVWQHKNALIEGFTKRHGAHILVWHESPETMYSAITLEKSLKRWKRAWKT